MDHRRSQQCFINDETESTRGQDLKHDGSLPNNDDDDKSVRLQIITQIPVVHENRDEDVRDDVVENEDNEDDDYPDSGYSQRKAMLEQVLTEYDQQHKHQKKLFQNKITTLQRGKEQQKDQHIKEISILKEMMEDKFNFIETTIEETMDREREEKNSSFREIEEHLVMRDNEVEGLLKIIAMQGDELEQAKKEREELKKEIQNILVTLHVQFERYDEKGFKSNAELTILREEHATTKKALTEEVSKVKQCLCMVQENVDQVQKETSESVTDTKNKITLAQRDTQSQFHKILDDQQAIVSGYLQRNNDKFEKINNDMKTIHTELDTHQALCDKLDIRHSTCTEQLKSTESAIIECRTVLTELNDYVYNEAAETMDGLILEKEAMFVQIQSLMENMTDVQTTITEMTRKANTQKLDTEFMGVKLKDALKTFEQKIQEQETTLMDEISCTNQSVKTVVEVMGSKLSDLRVEIHRQETSQESMNKKFSDKHLDLTDALDKKHKSIELSNQETAEIVEKMKGFAQVQETLKTQFMNAQAKHEVDLEQYKIKMNDWHTKFDGLMKMIQQRSEVQSLASRDFKTTQNDFEMKVKSCCTQLNTLERRVTHAEDSLCNTVTAGLVDVMIQPYINQNEHIDEMINKQMDEIKSMKDAMKTTQVDRTVITEKVDHMNQTWEALFQHLAGQMQKDTIDMNKTKKETDHVLKDVKRLTSVWEKNLDKLSKTQETSNHAMSMIKTLQSNVESCNNRVTKVIHMMGQQQGKASIEQMKLNEVASSHPVSDDGLKASVERLLNV